MQAYSVLYSYPTWDRHYRGQRGVRVHASNEASAARLALRRAPAGSKVLRVQLSRRQALEI